MNTSRRTFCCLRFGAPVSVLVLSVACTAPAVLRGRIAGAREIVHRAAEAGARNCAPRELALAETHLDFASAEVDQGDLGRAREHFDLAEPNARAAVRLSEPQRCTGTGAPADRDRDQIPDVADSCPDEPEDHDGHQDDDGCPEDRDSDEDGISNSSDSCPLTPEDLDGYLDRDGCPELDDDVDGIRDPDDRCPRDPEDIDGFEDTDGCSEVDNDRDTFQDTQDRCPNDPGIEAEHGCPRVYRDVEVTSTGIVIHQQVFFETNRAVIRSLSFRLLDTVAQVLRDYPDIRVEVQGHTDSRGNDQHNLELSQARADAVREYLMRAGIETNRLTSRGYGETTPIESNTTSDGRAANRRVEFRRTDLPRPSTQTP